MLLSERKFFKRKNRKRLYSLYITDMERAEAIADKYKAKVDALRNRKSDFATGSYIWTFLDKVEKDFTSSFEHWAYVRCAGIMRESVVITPDDYDEVLLDIQKLSCAIGNITSALDFVDYLEYNKLKVRAK